MTMEDESQGGFCGVGKCWSSFKNLFFSCSSNKFNDYHHNLIIIDNETASSISLDSIFQIMVRPPKKDWNQDLLRDGGRSEERYSNKNLFDEHSSFNSSKQLNQSFGIEQKPSDSQPQQSSIVLDKQEHDYSSSSPNYELKSTEIIPKTETPSPLPNLKVPKERLGDKITALQQLVSPFGKTDTASVLHETIGYIKYLHGQVSAMSSSPTSGNGSTPLQRQLLQDADEIKNEESLVTDLKSRGLCLVPISTASPLSVCPVHVLF